MLVPASVTADLCGKLHPDCRNGCTITIHREGQNHSYDAWIGRGDE
jgi:hypothetical protein